MTDLLKKQAGLLLCVFFFLAFTNCTKEYACQCTGTDIDGVESITVTTIEAKTTKAAEIACEAASVDIIFVSIECMVL